MGTRKREYCLEVHDLFLFSFQFHLKILIQTEKFLNNIFFLTALFKKKFMLTERLLVTKYLFMLLLCKAKKLVL